MTNLDIIWMQLHDRSTWPPLPAGYYDYGGPIWQLRCSVCRIEFVSRNSNQTVCSKTCRAEKHANYCREYKARHRKHRVCKYCGTAINRRRLQVCVDCKAQKRRERSQAVITAVSAACHAYRSLTGQHPEWRNAYRIYRAFRDLDLMEETP